MEKFLFICATPLQLLIASQILKKNRYKRNNCHLLYVVHSNNNKHNYYFNKFSNLFFKSIFLEYDGNPIKALYYLKAQGIDHFYNSIYLATISFRFFQFLLSRTTHQTLNTFDDGTANILPSSSFYVDELGFKRKIKDAIYKLIGNRHPTAHIKEKTIRHYSIYKNTLNIISSPVFLELFDNESTNPSPSNKNEHATVFLGSCIDSIIANGKYRDALISRLQYFLLNTPHQTLYYLPHPLGEKMDIPFLEASETHLIAEDFIKTILCKHETVLLIGFSSSAQINLSETKGIRNICLTSKLLNKRFNELALIMEKMGAAIHSIDPPSDET